MLAAFLLYLRRFFEPMQELSQFYNSLQSATAALEKLSGVLQERAGRARAGRPRPLPARTPAARSTFDRRDASATGGTGSCCPTSTCTSRPGRRSRWSAPPGPASPRSPSWSPRFYDPVDGTVRLDGVDLRDLADDDLRRGVVMVTQENFLFSGTIAENIALRPARAPAGPRSRRRPQAIGADDVHPRRCPRGTTPTSASAAGGCRPGSVSWSRSPARSWPTRPC